MQQSPNTIKQSTSALSAFLTVSSLIFLGMSSPWTAKTLSYLLLALKQTHGCNCSHYGSSNRRTWLKSHQNSIRSCYRSVRTVMRNYCVLNRRPHMLKNSFFRFLRFFPFGQQQRRVGLHNRDRLALTRCVPSLLSLNRALRSGRILFISSTMPSTWKGRSNIPRSSYFADRERTTQPRIFQPSNSDKSHTRDRIGNISQCQHCLQDSRK